MPRARLLVATLLALSSLLAGCGDDDEGGGGEVEALAAQEVRKSAKLEETWPLTGLPVSGGNSSSQVHPVLVLKMDNTYSSAPQLGLSSADLVVEELVEGGMTRLAAFFYSDIPGEVGPVRSMRASDIGIVSPVDGAMVTSGAAPVTIKRIADADIAFFAEGDPGFARDGARSAPYNLMADLDELADTFGDDEERPDDYLPWGEASDLPDGQKATTIAASFSAGHTTNWVFRDGGYVNPNTFAADGDEFPAETVLVLRVEVRDAGYLDPAGNPVPETKLEGKGAAMLFHDGRFVRGTWKKNSLESELTLETKAGPLKVPAGRTWIELVPTSGGSVEFGN